MDRLDRQFRNTPSVLHSCVVYLIMWTESRLDLVDDAIQNPTLLAHLLVYQLFVSPGYSGTHLKLKIYTLVTELHLSATMYTYGSNLHPRYVLEHSLEVYMYTPILTVHLLYIQIIQKKCYGYLIICHPMQQLPSLFYVVYKHL